MSSLSVTASRAPLSQWLADGQISAERVALHHITHDSSGVFRDLELVGDTVLRERLAENPHGNARARRVLAAMQPFATSTLDSLQTGALVLDGALKVSVANHASLRPMGLQEAELLTRAFTDLDGGAWNLSGLERGLWALDGQLQVLRLEHRVGARHLAIEGRRIDQTRSFCLMLREEGPTAVTRDAGLRAELDVSAEAVLMASDAGAILFANPEAHRLFGFVPGGLVGQGLSRLLIAPERVRAPAPSRAWQRLDARRADGSRLEVSISLNWISFEGRPVVLCFAADAKRREASDERISEYEQRLTFEATAIAEQERRRIAVELHDRIGQSLALARLKLKSAVGDGHSAEAHAIHDALTLLEGAANDTRTLSFELSPPVLYDLGLAAALSWLADDLKDKHQLEVALDDASAPFTLDEVTAAVVFRCARELLMNVLKHARVSKATVRLRTTAEHLQLVVEDEGVGFDVEVQLAVLRRGGFGLPSVRAQLRRLGGDLITESRPGHGTRLEARVPLVRAS